MTKNKGFASSLGALMVAIGCAVGLGNIWKFPYEMGKEGGALFLIGYIIVTLVICIPLMVAEFATGRAGKGGNIKGSQKLAPNSSWWFTGVLALIVNLLISFFYVVVGGWIIYYLFATLLKHININTDSALYFNHLISNQLSSIFGSLIFLGICFFIIIRGVEKGLEKFSMWMIPFLGLFLIALTVYSFTLPNVKEAMMYVFKPDFSQFTPNTVISIISQAFFSLSLGMGVMVLYGSYMLKTDNLIKTAINTSLISAVLVAILSSMLVFNISFAYHIPPMAGPGLIFMAFPKIFAAMKGGYIIGIVFYLLVLLAAVTSMLGLIEMPVAFLIAHTKFNRKQATILTTLLIFIMGSLVSMSMAGAIPMFKINVISLIVVIAIALLIAGLLYPSFVNHIKITYNKNHDLSKFYGLVLSLITFAIILAVFDYSVNKNWFDLFDQITSNFLIPIGGVLTAVFFAWIIDKNIVKHELSSSGAGNFVTNSIIFLNRYVIPLIIIIMLIFPFI